MHYLDKNKLLDFAPKAPITRFAPSPTGYLHMGHIISMIYVFGIAEIIGAKVLLRIEDHDLERSRSEYEKAILDDIAWLGFIPDNWTDISSGKPSSYRQSDNLEVYAQHLQSLWKKDFLYCCNCSRKQLTEAQAAPMNENTETPYQGICRDKRLGHDNDYGIRLKVDDSVFSFQDLLLGKQQHLPKNQCGDFIIQDRRHNYTYNFAVVADDIRHGINTIVRGIDILHCTGRQIALCRILGHESNNSYIHHPLVYGPDGKKLSKRFFSEGIISRRQAGDNPANILGEALHLGGFLPRTIPVKVSEIPKILLGG